MKKILILVFSLSILFASYSCGKKGGLNPADKISFNFEIEGRGVLELSVTNSRGVSLYNYTVENAEEKVGIEESIVQGNTLVAKANAGKGYVFNAWDGVSEAIGDAVIVPESLAESTIKVSFIQNPYTGTQNAKDPEKEDDYDAGDGWIWVYKPEHIKWISDTVNNGYSLNTKKYKFRNDISFNGKDHTSIGNYDNVFSGKIDGNGKSIKYAVIKASGDSTGFIGYMRDGEIKNLTIDSTVTIDGNTYVVAGIAGRTYKSKISYSTNKAEIKNSGTCTAGIVAEANASVLEYLANEGNILARGDNVSDAGGIVGFISSTTDSGVSKISYSYNTGNITADNTKDAYTVSAGGIAGSINLNGVAYENPNSVNIEKCYNSGNVSLNATPSNNGFIEKKYAGGIAGYGAINILDCYNTGNIKSAFFAGSIVGNDYYNGLYTFSLSIANCYSTTSPSPYTGSDKSKLGGIAGNVLSTAIISKAYFVNTTGLRENGYSASSEANTGDSLNRTKTVGDLSTLHNELGTSVWGTKNGRPVIKGLGEGVIN